MKIIGKINVHAKLQITHNFIWMGCTIQFCTRSALVLPALSEHVLKCDSGGCDLVI